MPPLTVFTNNDYKIYDIPDLDRERIDRIIYFNAIKDGGTDVSHLFGLRSLINHNKDSNLYEIRNGNRTLLFAKRDIQKGEQLVIDYCPLLKDPKKRLVFLRHIGIQEVSVEEIEKLSEK